jgi:hypothetical protein
VSEFPPQVWKRDAPLGRAEVIRGLGGVVAPLLAGFSLAAIVTIRTADGKPVLLADWATAAFALAAVLLLGGMQLAFVGLMHSAPPDQHFAWHPEAAVDVDRLEEARFEQATDRWLASVFWDRTRVLYNAGLVAFLLGVLLLLVPRTWTLPRSAGVAIAGAGMLFELLWAFSPSRRLRGLLQPEYEHVKTRITLSTLDTTSLRSVLRGLESYEAPRREPEPEKLDDVVALVQASPDITVNEIRRHLGLRADAVFALLGELSVTGRIERRGAGGHGKVRITSTPVERAGSR